MTCSRCGNKTYVQTTREIDGVVIRLRICKKCAARFYTRESQINYNNGLAMLSKFYHNQYRRNKKDADKI